MGGSSHGMTPANMSAAHVRIFGPEPMNGNSANMPKCQPVTGAASGAGLAWVWGEEGMGASAYSRFSSL